MMIATHDSDLIVRGAVIFGTNKQPECIVRRIGLCHRTCAPSRCCGHAHLPRPAALICTGLLSYLVNCPGTVCPRDRPHYTADARKKGERRCDQRCLRQRYSRLPCCNSVKTREHHSHVSNVSVIRGHVKFVPIPNADNFNGVVAKSFGSSFRWASWTYSFCDQVEPFAV